jgi:hypothetical protein
VEIIHDLKCSHEVSRKNACKLTFLTNEPGDRRPAAINKQTKQNIMIAIATAKLCRAIVVTRRPIPKLYATLLALSSSSGRRHYYLAHQQQPLLMRQRRPLEPHHEAAVIAPRFIPKRGTATLVMPSAASTTIGGGGGGSTTSMTMVNRRRYDPPSWRLVGGAAVAVLGIGCGLGQYYYGYQKDFFDYRFVLTRDDIDPDDLASFYGGEEFMELFCVVPFMGTLMMRGGHFDDEGTVHTTGFPGDMQVSMVFSDENDEDGTTKWFNKRERFRDVLFGRYTCWGMITNFGFQRLDDGRLLVYHHGEYFTSRLPPFSLLARLIFGLHARWVAWATEHYLNHYAFPPDNDDDDHNNDNNIDEALDEQARADMPMFLLTHYGPSDLMNMFWGHSDDQKTPSFLLQNRRRRQEEEDDDDARALRATEDELTRLLPVHSPRLQRHMTIDIYQDRVNAKSALVPQYGDTDEQQPSTRRDDTQIPLRVGLRRSVTLTRRMTNGADEEEDEEEEGPILRDGDSGGRRQQYQGGSVAWESVRATNDPKAYQAVTLAARERQLQRKATAQRPVPPTDKE